MKKIVLILSLFASFFTLSQAQPRGFNNYLGLTVGGGLSTMAYSPEHGSHGMGLGFGGGLHYARFVNTDYGFGIGVRYNYTRASSSYDATHTTYGMTHPDNPGVEYDLTTSFDGWKEHQTVGYLSIPVEFLWRKPLSKKFMLIGGAGAQLDVPLHNEYNANEGAYHTTGYFPATGHTVSDQPQHGFGTYKANSKGEISNLSIGLSLIADFGIRMALNRHWGLYLGLYAGYGLTSGLDKEMKAPLVELNASDASQIDYHNTLSSNEVGSMHLLCAGLKIGIDVGWNRLFKSRTSHRYPWSRVHIECTR